MPPATLSSADLLPDGTGIRAQRRALLQSARRGRLRIPAMVAVDATAGRAIVGPGQVWTPYGLRRPV